MTSPVKETPGRGVRAVHRASASANWGTFSDGQSRDLDSLHPGRQGALDEGQLLRGRDGLSLVLQPIPGLTSMSAVMVGA